MACISISVSVFGFFGSIAFYIIYKKFEEKYDLRYLKLEIYDKDNQNLKEKLSEILEDIKYIRGRIDERK